ncbi:response regulator transcription factor [Longitalea luteola]|uniref:response regulator transcription factor n=1 Tax=Longitalea luteola TaxID=2812563 RepID=UPI001A977DB0|nr:response regulator [Longitalea luteola]
MRKVTIIEDDPAISDAINILFTRAGFNPATYPNGNFILNGEYDIPDLFIIDKQLSGVDGLEICRHLKQSPSTQHIPVLILSATPHLRALINQAGADAFLEKPFSNQHLLQLAEKLIKGH